MDKPRLLEHVRRAIRVPRFRTLHRSIGENKSVPVFLYKSGVPFDADYAIKQAKSA